jgi:hypothetical protein
MKAGMVVTVLAIASFLPRTGTGAQDTAFVRVLKAHSAPFSVEQGRMRGAGGDSLAQVARQHQFILVGEDHGIREVPEFVTALWNAARPAGYSHLAVEIGPVTGTRLESMLRTPDPMTAVDQFLGRYTAFTLPFFFWKEESQMLVDAMKSMPGKRDVIWGIDQEFMIAPTYLLERLAQIGTTPSARALASQLAEASARGDKAMITQGNPGATWMVTTTDADMARLRAAFNAAPGSEAARIIDELSVSRDIYGKYNKGLGYESNQQRANLMRQHFLTAYRAAQARGERLPRAIVKLGANHVFRGPSITNSYEMGSFLPELAQMNGTESFGILLVVAKGTWNAYRPFGSKEEDKTKAYDPLTTDEYTVFDLKSVLDATGDSTWTYVDLRPVRAAAGTRKFRQLDPRARRLLNSFDAVVVVPEGHASVYFR